MEQFNLEKYLENPSRKVVTRRGNPVRIICTDRKHGEDELPVVFLEQCHNGEFLLACRKDGRSDTYDTPYDLFFADEEEELTEFEKAVQSICKNLRDGIDDIGDIHVLSNNLLDLARKELLKDLPKWKKSTLPIPDEEYPTGFNCKYFCYKGYCIDYKKLFETLPKEE